MPCRGRFGVCNKIGCPQVPPGVSGLAARTGASVCRQQRTPTVRERGRECCVQQSIAAKGSRGKSAHAAAAHDGRRRSRSQVSSESLLLTHRHSLHPREVGDELTAVHIAQAVHAVRRYSSGKTRGEGWGEGRAAWAGGWRGRLLTQRCSLWRTHLSSLHTVHRPPGPSPVIP